MEEKKENPSIQRNSLTESTRVEKILAPVTLRDLMLFKEEVLKEMKIYQNKIDISISNNYEKCSQLLEASNKKLYNYETDKALFMKQIEFIEEKNKFLSVIDEKNNEIKNQLMVTDLHLKTCQKDIDNATFKYDKVIIDHLLIPSMVGIGCKFPYLKEYINDIQGQINMANINIRKNENNLTANKINTEGQIRNLNTKVKNLEYESKQFTNEKAILLDKKFSEMFESLSNQLTTATTEYVKSKYELKDKVSEAKAVASFLIEENRKINIKTITEFEKIKKNFTKMKKTIVELSSLLTAGGSYTGTGKFNKNIANNRQQIIQNFNSMIIDLMKDVTKGNSSEFHNELNNVLFPTKKNVGSLVKQYIKGKINADDTKFDDKAKKSKKALNKKTTTAVIFIKNSTKKVNSIPKNEDLNLKLNSDLNNTGTNYNKFNRFASFEIKDVVSKNNLATNNNNFEIIQKRNKLSNNKSSSKIHVIKEENNNISKSFGDSFSDDSEEDNLNVKLNNNNLAYNTFTSKNIEDILNSDSYKKDKRKFFRAATSNYDNKFFNVKFNNNSVEKFKLLQKAQENAKKKNYETKKSSRNESITTPNKSKREYNNEDKDKVNINKNEDKSININNINSANSVNKNKVEDKSFIPNLDVMKHLENIKIENNIKNNINEVINKNKIDNKTQTQNIEFIKMLENRTIENNENSSKNEKNKDINDNKNNKFKQDNTINSNSDKNMEQNKNITKKEEEKDISSQKNNTIINNNNSSPISIRSKNIINMKSNIQKNQAIQNNINSKFSKKPNYSPESNFIKYNKNITNTKKTNNVKKENLISQTENLNTNNNILTTSNQYHTHENINNYKNSTLSAVNKKRPLSIMSSCQTRPISKYKLKNRFNIFNEDIFINKNMINKINYCRDEDIIDKPLLINQTDFKVDNLKGSLENKLMELEYFTKRKLDELVREIKNFIPIHFNAYLKE